MSKVVCFATGGTIASTYDAEAGGLLPTIDAADFIDGLPGLREVAAVEVTQLARMGSTSLDPRRVFEWSGAVTEALVRPEVCGAVMMQGTNALEECAYLFDLTIPAGKPVIFTGAMKTSEEPGFDGERNFLDAVAVAVSEDSHGLGTLVVANGEIHAAREVEKTHTSAVDAFGSGCEPVGGVDGDRCVSIRRRPAFREHIPAPRLEPNVALLSACLGADGALVEAAVRAGQRGIVVAGAGAGDVPAQMGCGLARAVESGVPVVVARRAAGGRVEPRYAGRGEGRWLADRGVLFAADLSAVKARIKLMLCLGLGIEDAPGIYFEGVVEPSGTSFA